MNANTPLSLAPQPLEAHSFAPFGDVIEPGQDKVTINSGTCLKYPDLAELTLTQHNGKAAVHVYHAQPCQLPFTVTMLERHPLSSQLFMPLTERPYLVVVAPAGEAINADQIRVFWCRHNQGVNYHPGTWHHPLLALDTLSEFLVVDRVGLEPNCDEMTLQTQLTIHEEGIHK